MVYAASLHETDLAVQAFDGSVRIQAILNGPNSPSKLSYPVSIPVGGNASLTESGGVLVVDAEGLPVGGFAAPWAKDSQGYDVPTHYEVQGSTVVQVVDHKDAAYPVAADPGSGKTSSVAPPGFAMTRVSRCRSHRRGGPA